MDGVITSWRTRAAVNGSMAFHVVRRSSGTTFRVVATDGRTVTTGSIQEFSVNLPVREGDLLGLDAPGSDEPFRSASSALAARFVPPLSSEPVEPAAHLSNTELLVDAVVEPDADGDTFGDDTQDQCPTNPATQGACSGILIGPSLLGDSAWPFALSVGGGAETITRS